MYTKSIGMKKVTTAVMRDFTAITGPYGLPTGAAISCHGSGNHSGHSFLHGCAS